MGMMFYGVLEASGCHGNAEIHMRTNFTFMHRTVCKLMRSDEVVLMVIMETLKYTCLQCFITVRAINAKYKY